MNAMSENDPNTKVDHFGLPWSPLMQMIHVHMWFIKKGGQFTRANGTVAGNGLFFHYSELSKLLWPEEDDHRWWQLCLKTILENPITPILGPKDSGKTHCMAKFGLMDYWCFPAATLILISSTDVRGLEYRIWGDLKGLYQRARSRFDFLAGHLIDSKHAICTDNLQEEQVRDMRKGIVCIPCVSSNGQFVGLGKYVGLKQKRRRLLSDECFPAGTMIDTRNGARPIEKIRVGDYVWSAAGLSRVHGTGLRTATALVKIHCKNGRTVTCTPDHPFFTQKGWIKACDLNQSHYIISTNEAMRLLRQSIPTVRKPKSLSKLSDDQKKEKLRSMRKIISVATDQFDYSFLQSILFSEMEDKPAGISCPVIHQRTEQEDWPFQASNAQGSSRICRSFSSEVYSQFMVESAGKQKAHQRAFKSHRTQTQNPWWQWHWANSSRASIAKTISERKAELSGSNENEKGQRISTLLQAGYSVSKYSAWNRSRWFVPRSFESKSTGCQKNQIPSGAWVDCVTLFQSTHFREQQRSSSGTTVYNLQVEGHPSYSVNGLLVHNCQFMKPAFLDSLANLNSGDFKGVFVGNPLGEGDPLDKIAEPKDGWHSIEEPEKTTSWENKFGGVTINLVGTDSPNFDFPQEDKPRYPYLIHQKEIQKVEDFYGKNSLQYYSQVKGVRKTGLYARRVITLTLCKQFRAMEKAVWMDTKQTKVYAVDAAYGSVGGDRCVGGAVEFGRSADGNNIILNVNQPVIIPIAPRSDKVPEDQIAQFVKEDCERQGIPPEHVFYDSTGRGSLGTSFARLWSANVNPVEFGGSPTGRAVADLMIRDKATGLMRAKRADEHFSKFVTEIWFSVRYVIESWQMRNMPLEVIDDACSREWYMVRGDKIEIEPKEETRKRTNRSPDLMDWLATAVEGARRLGFSIAKLSLQAPQADDEWKQSLVRKAKALRHHGQLSYART